jgi:hypothetical protein
MRPAAGDVLHFSEDPTITVFRPHVAPTAQQATPYVWAVGQAGINVRVLPRLHGLWSAVITSTLEFGGIRLRNARS